jgi:hypothetical protein
MATSTSCTRVKGGDEHPRKQTSPPTLNASWVLRIDLSNLSETADDATAGQDGSQTGVLALDLLAGDTANIERYGSVDWLEDVAHGLLDPIQRRGRLWTYKDGSREHWVTAALDSERWEEVRVGAPIESRIYEYYTPTRPDPGFLVTKMSPKSRLSRTSAGAENYASTFRDMVEKRDLRCVISGVYHNDMPNRCMASHLIPKRLREALPQITHRYVDIPGLVFDGGMWDPRIGIFLEDRLATSVDLFYMSFHRLRVSSCTQAQLLKTDSLQDDQAGHYVIHLFHDNDLYAANGHQVKHGADITFRRSIPNGQLLSEQLCRLGLAELPRPNAHRAAAEGVQDPDETGREETTAPDNNQDGMFDNDNASASNELEEYDESSGADALGSQMTGSTQSDDEDTTHSALALRRTPLAALDSAADRLEPPEGVFLWHYIQCVTLRFATPQFKALQGALHTEKPSRYHGDSDDDSDDALDNLDYPTKWLDDAWAAAEEAKMARDRLALLFNLSKDD